MKNQNINNTSLTVTLTITKFSLCFLMAGLGNRVDYFHTSNKNKTMLYLLRHIDDMVNINHNGLNITATLSALFSLTKGVTRNLGGFSLPIVYLFNLFIIYFHTSIFQSLILQVLAPQMLTDKVRQCL